MAKVRVWQDHLKVIYRYSTKRDKERIQDDLVCERKEKRSKRKVKDESIVLESKG